jgi:hypothetical protein
MRFRICEASRNGVWVGVMACLLTSLFLIRTISGQSVKGTLAGTVTDTNHNSIIGASVVVVNVSTGEKFETITTSSGDYRLPQISLGIYTVTISEPGFSSAKYDGVRITVNSVTVQDAILKIGQVQDTITVAANALTLQTESSEISGTIGTKEIIDLPLALGGVGALRSPQGFMFLLPGNTGPGAGTSSNSTNNTNGVSLNKIGGGQNFGAEILVDGASQSRTNNGSNFDEEAPSVEALQEFKTTDFTPSAEFGRTTGGVMSFATKAGTDSYHGTLFDIFRNDDMDANTWFNKGRSTMNCVGANDTPSCRSTYRRPSDKQNDYGNSLGGPINIPHFYRGSGRTFFHFTWEQFTQTVGASITSTVPTALARQGNFSEYLQTSQKLGTNPCDGSAIYFGQVFDPSTTRTVGGVPCRTAFAGNVVTTAISPVAKALMNYYPQPQTSGLISNYTFASSYPLTNTTYTIRIDENITDNDRIFASYSARQNTRRSGSRSLPDPVDPNEFQQNFITHFGRAGWDHTFSPTLLNHVNFGSNRALGNNFATAALGSTNYSMALGISNISSMNFPVTSVGENISSLGNGNNNRRADNSLLLQDSLSWQKGSHSFMFGADVRYYQLTSASYPAPSFNFGRGQTAASSSSTYVSNTGNGFASLYLGLPQSGTTQLYANVPRWIHWYYAGFIKDDYKVTKQLALNLGLRYEVETPRYEAHNGTSNLSLAANDPTYNIPGALVFGSNCDCDNKWLNTWTKDIGPRVGFAYTPDRLAGRTTIRGGAAILYGPLQYFDSGSNMQNGFSTSPSFTSSDSFNPAFKIDNGFPSFAPPPIFNPSFFDGTSAGNFIAVKNARPGTIYMWSAQIQQQITSNTILSVGYAGQRDNSLPSALSAINNIPTKYFALGNALTQPLATNTVGVAAPFNGFTSLFKTGQVQQALKPYPQFTNINSTCCFENLGQGSYHALLISLNREMHSGLHYLVSYTWAKNLTDADSAVPSNNAGIQGIQDPTNLKGEKALSVQDIPHTLVVSYLYELPFGRSKLLFVNSPKIVNAAISGWELGGIQRYQAGTPFSFACASSIPGTNTCSRFSFTGASIWSAAKLSGKLSPLAGSTANPATNSMFNGAAGGSTTAAVQTNPAFYDQNYVSFRGTGAYTYGNVPRVTARVRLNPFLNEDFSLIKSTPIREGVRFILEVQALNAFNRHAWATPGLDPNGQQFGVPTDTIVKPRQLQLTARVSF